MVQAHQAAVGMEAEMVQAHQAAVGMEAEMASQAQTLMMNNQCQPSLM